MINIREVIRRLLKYAVMIIIVGFATYSIPNKPPSNTEIIWISLIAGMVFSVIDSVTPSIKIHVEKKFAGQLIAEDLLKSDLVSELPHYHNGIVNILETVKVNLIKIKSSIIRFIKKYKMGVLLPNKMEGGITKKQINDILKNFEPDHNLKVRQVLTDCVEIE